MATGGARGRWRGLAVAVAALVGVSTITACDPVDDAQPPVASVNFQPRLTITVGPDGLVAEVGERDDARLDGADEATVKKGSVVELHEADGGSGRVVITRAPLESTDPADADVWLDTGTMEPGESTVLGLSAIGTYRFGLTGGAGSSSELTVHVVA